MGWKSRRRIGFFSFFLFSSFSFALVPNTDIASLPSLLASKPPQSPLQAERGREGNDEARKRQPLRCLLHRTVPLTAPRLSARPSESTHNSVEQVDRKEPTSFPLSTALPLSRLSLADNMPSSPLENATDVSTPTLPPPVPSAATPTLPPSSPLLITVLPASPSDLPLLAQLQRKAFATSPVDLLIFRDVSEADYLAHWIERMSKALADPYKAVCKAVDGEGTVVGMALWETPKPEGYPGKKEERKWMPRTNVELAEELFSQRGSPETDGLPQYRESILVVMIRLTKSNNPSLSRFSRRADLSVLAVDPSRQRTGAGRALMEWGCRKADEEGVIMTLKGTEGALPPFSPVFDPLSSARLARFRLPRTVAVPLYERFRFRQNRPPVTAAQGQISVRLSASVFLRSCFLGP